MNRGRRRQQKADAAVATEVELKLRFPPSRLRDVLASPLLPGVRRTAGRRLAATYYDTPALDLWRRRIALRVRREGGRWVQTVKGGGSAASGVHRRLEIEIPLTDPRPDLSGLPRHAVTRVLRSRKVAEAVTPVFHTAITRSPCLLEPAPGVLIEAAIDRGTVRSGRRREAVCEIELELKRGPVTALFDLALRLAAQLPLAPEHRSKAQRGYALFRGSDMPPAKAVAPVLDRSMSTGEAFCAIAGNALAQAQANEYGVIHGDDPEYLHQMRVGIRRLRSAFRLFRDLLGEAAAPPAGALRAIAADLGPARDWDVLVTETLPAIAAMLPAERLSPAFFAACARQRALARRKLKISIKTNTYNESMLVLGQWLARLGDGPGQAAWRRPVRGSAAKILAAWHARVLRRGRHLEQCSSAELHRLRIAVKQLRYAVEFFSGLFSQRRMAALRDHLVRLQDILGRINDAASVESLLGGAVVSGGCAAQTPAGIVIGWCEARAAGERAALQAAWRRFRAAPQPWRE
ncbi:MAG: CHAD domain-containing protein [Burkholderiales bacterium]|nr:CHAD domain-containing protein [Burkholderiales bacterium]